MHIILNFVSSDQPAAAACARRPATVQPGSCRVRVHGWRQCAWRTAVHNTDPHGRADRSAAGVRCSHQAGVDCARNPVVALPTADVFLPRARGGTRNARNGPEIGQKIRPMPETGPKPSGTCVQGRRRISHGFSGRFGRRMSVGSILRSMTVRRTRPASPPLSGWCTTRFRRGYAYRSHSTLAPRKII